MSRPTDPDRVAMAPLLDDDAAKFITNELRIRWRYARAIADNGESGDQRIIIMVAPAISNEPTECVWLETNGDPSYLGTLDGIRFTPVNETFANDWPWVDEALYVEGITVVL